jgi:hypothetical protein
MIVSEKEIKLKDGSTLPKGAPVEFIEDNATQCRVAGRLVRITSAFIAPSVEQLQEWEYDCGCETPAGEWTEPDGYGESGAPSWLMVMGMI